MPTVEAEERWGWAGMGVGQDCLRHTEECCGFREPRMVLAWEWLPGTVLYPGELGRAAERDKVCREKTTLASGLSVG